MNIRLSIWIGIGGMIGATARYSISFLFAGLSGYPYATLITNFIGCFLLSFLLSSVIVKEKLSAKIRTALGTGVIGSFTTFSTFALETVQLWDRSIVLALTYMILSVCGGLLCCYAGFKLANNEQRSDAV